MTSHSLVRCSPERLLGHAAQRHAVNSPQPLAPFPRWREAEPLAGRSTCWCTRLPDGSLVEWCLEVEPGANGVLAHLSAALVAGRMARAPRMLQRLALRRWTGYELARLARVVEAEASSGRDSVPAARRGQAAIG